MASKIKLQIDDPCSENWDKMNRTEKGRFCQACQKQVIDFTGMSEQQLALFFKSNKTNVCGRMRSDQLEQELTIPRKRIHWFRYFLQVALPTFIFSAKGYTQGDVKARPAVMNQDKRTDPSIIQIAIPDQPAMPRTLTGKIVDQDGKAIPAASILVRGTSSGALTDDKGAFRLEILQEDTLVSLEISCISYTPLLVEIKKEDRFDQPVVFRLSKHEEIFMGLMTVAAPKKKVKVKWDKTAAGGSGISGTPKLIQSTNDTAARSFRVFPNPVTSGSSLNIELTSQPEEGYYNLSISAIDGKTVFQKNECWIDADARVMNIAIPALTPGNYVLGLRNKKNGKVDSRLIVIKAE